MKNSHSIYCTSYEILREPGDITRISADFVFVTQSTEQTAEMMKKIELLLSSGDGIALVKGQDKPRCSYCGVLAEGEETTCKKCGGIL